MFIQYWSMRVMAYLATLVMLFALWGAWLLYRHKLDRARWFLRVAPWVVIVPFLMNTAGWMLTENGRQPWIVQGLMKTANGVSPSVSATDIWISLVVFYVVFIAFGIADGWLMIRYGRKELDHDPIARLVEHTDPVRPSHFARRRRRAGARLLGGPMTLGDVWFIIVASSGSASSSWRASTSAWACCTVPRPHRHRTPRADQHHRAGLGRQRGMAHRGRAP